MFSSLIRAFQDGGFFMYPIAIGMGFAIAVTIERARFLMGRFNVDGAKFYAEIKGLLERGNYKAASELCGGAPLMQILKAGIDAAPQGDKAVQNAVDEATLSLLPEVEKRTHYLSMIANVSTLMGLIGTVTGLIRSFKAVAYADPTQKGALLFKGISEAMNCTAFGLIVAIPCMVIYTVLQTKTTHIVDEVDEYSVKLINLLASLRGGK